MRRNMVFHTAKHNLWRSETLPLANSYFVNRPFTDKYPCNHLSINTLQKTSKIAVFSTKNTSVQKDGLNLGSKFEYYLTKSRSPDLKSGCSVPAHLQCPSAIIVLTNAPLKGAMSHQPKAEPWGTRATEQTVYTDRGRCQRHRTMVASHTEKPLGFSKWLERNSPHKNIACPWVGDIV